MKIKGFPEYTVTKDGSVYRRGKKLKSYDNGNGYRQVKLYKNGVRYTKNIHRLVMGEPSNEVDHIDNNKSNNDISNLQVMTHRDNIRKNFEK